MFAKSVRLPIISTFREGADRLSQLKTMVLRIDKCDNFSTAGMFYTNVSRLMADDPHW